LGVNINEKSVAAIPIFESYARTNADTLEAVMHVNPTPKFDESKLLMEYATLVEQGNLNDEKLQQLEHQLIKKIGEDHPELIRLELVKRRRKILES